MRWPTFQMAETPAVMSRAARRMSVSSTATTTSTTVNTTSDQVQTLAMVSADGCCMMISDLSGSARAGVRLECGGECAALRFDLLHGGEHLTRHLVCRLERPDGHCTLANALGGLQRAHRLGVNAAGGTPDDDEQHGGADDHECRNAHPQPPRGPELRVSHSSAPP